MQEYEIAVEWKGLEIHPEFPAAGLLRSAFGGPRMRAVEENLQHLAAESGLSMGSPDPLANTHLALLAAEFARDAGRFEPFHRRLFEAYFQEGQNIGERPVLRAAAQEVGLDLARLEQALDSERYEERLEEVRREAGTLGISGIPTFVMEGMWLVGAQPQELLRRMAERAGAQKRATKHDG